MRALVTGGAGFLGRYLCRHLLERGYEVVAVDNLSTSFGEELGELQERPGFTFIKHDIVQPFLLDGPLDAILHLASPASPPYFADHPIETLLASSVGTYNMLELATQRGAVFLLASTSEVYGDPEESPQSEEYRGSVAITGPRAPYDEGKRFAEALTLAYQRARGVSVRIARIFNTYGPGMQSGDGRVIPNFIAQALTNRPLTVYGDGEQTRSFCYVSDLIDGLFKLLVSDVQVSVNLGNPHEMTILELARLVLEETKSQSLLDHRPGLENDPRQRCPDITRARTLLGWEPKVELREGLRWTIASFRERLARTGGGGP